MEIKDIIKENNFEFKKKFGQNFITDTNLLEAIVGDAEIKDTDEVLEIGVGAGTLTKVLAQNCKKVVGFEIDKSLFDVLSMSLKGYENIDIVFKDFLKTDAEEVNAMFDKEFKVVANLPYYITTNIIFKLVEEKFNIQSLTLMVQKEVAERIVSQPGTKEYGTITAELDAIADVEIKRIVNRQMFMPMPNVDSAILNIKLNKNKYQIADIELLRKVIRASFSMRRKTLANCLKTNFGFNSEQLDYIYQKLGYDKNIRGEVLTTADFVNLSNIIAGLE
ncbi:MAG: ribosomal RNA small subunit methyltransferase A [Clostridia bacterium]|nr:ribosomal RNA small subunit methyltransferase A [Clostridia bacterium]